MHATYRFDLIVTVAVVEVMTALPAPEAKQLIQSTLQDPRVHMLPLQPHNISYSGFYHIQILYLILLKLFSCRDFPRCFHIW